jgi:hypothetical protein
MSEPEIAASNRHKRDLRRRRRKLMGWTPPDGIDVPKWRR